MIFAEDALPFRFADWTGNAWRRRVQELSQSGNENPQAGKIADLRLKPCASYGEANRRNTAGLAKLMGTGTKFVAVEPGHVNQFVASPMARLFVCTCNFQPKCVAGQETFKLPPLTEVPNVGDVSGTPVTFNLIAVPESCSVAVTPEGRVPS